VTQRLLIIVDAAALGGVTRIVVNLTLGLRARGWDVRTVFPSWANDEFVAWCRGQGFEPELSPALSALSSAGVRSALRSQLLLQSLIRHARPDVVNFHYSGSIVSAKDVLAARLAGAARVIASVHLVARWDREALFRRPMTALASLMTDRVVAESHAAAQGELDAGVPRSRLTVIPNGAQVPNSALSQQTARAQLGIQADEFIAGTAVRLEPVKRVQDLIQAVATLRDEGVPARALIAGSGSESSALERLAQTIAPGGIEFLGQSPDPTNLYLASDVVVLPSEIEGLPNMPIEAALCGTACIGTAVGGTTEIVVDGETGFLVPVAAPREIARRLSALYVDRDLVRRMGAAAQKRATEHFTVDHMVSRYEAVLGPGPKRRDARR
jgi:glycosyltransferase involved in cell wall biosynthesis